MKTEMTKIKIAFAATVFAAAISVGFAQNIRAQQSPRPEVLKFDITLQADFTKAMSGDAAARTRAMERADKILASNPTDAETLVWRGSANAAGAGKAFQSGNYQEGWMQWQKGLGEMDKAVELAPNSFIVRIVRGSTYINAAKRFPDPAVAKDLRDKGVADYEKILNMTDEKSVNMAATQKPRILNSLIEAYEKTGDTAKAAVYREQLAKLGK